MLVTPDFTESQDTFTPGEYMFRVTGVEQKTSKNDQPYLNWTMEQINAADPKNNGRKHWHITMLAGRGAGMLKDFYKACTGETLEGQFDTEQLIGKELIVVLGEDNQGRIATKGLKQIQ